MRQTLHPFLESFVPPRPPFAPHHHPLSTPDRRLAPSPLEHASATLANAIEYLLTEQLAGRRPDLRANRDAVALLCDAGRQLLPLERRAQPRATLAAWLRSRTLNRLRRDRAA